jgi:hypothetical protein
MELKLFYCLEPEGRKELAIVTDIVEEPTRQALMSH